jgi:hypothetical protein
MEVRQVTQGVRQEPMRLAPRPGAEARLALEIRVAEQLGASCLVTLGRGDWALTVRREGPAPAVGSTVEAELPLRAAHLFDAADGRTLSHARPDG